MLARRGDQVASLDHHDRPVFALAALGTGPARLLSGSWDGYTAELGPGATGALLGRRVHHGSSVLAMASLHDSTFSRTV